MDQAGAQASPHIAYCGGSFGRVSLMTADVELGEHARDCMQLLVNVHSAGLAVRVDGATRALKPFDGMVIRPRETYAIPRQPGAPVVAGTVGFLLVKANTPVGAGWRWDAAQRMPSQALSGAARDDVQQLVHDLLRDLPHAESIERGVRTLQAAIGPRRGDSVAREQRGGLQAHIAREAESISLDDLQEFGSLQRAAAHGISERHFLTLFRRATRLAPKAFYNMRRLEAAFALLGDASRTVADIAYDLGFSAPPHFTRFMRANTGWTPSGYRARLQHLPPPLRPRWDAALRANA